MKSILIGKKVIVRGDRSGVFFGILDEKEGIQVRLTNCRRLWSWEGAASISQLAIDGTKKQSECRFTVAVASIEITDVLEIIPCTEKSINSIEGVPEWKL
mgnify:FL=1